MLSVLIPTYNYNVFPLVQAISSQCITSGILHEVIVMDDASDNFAIENEAIPSLANCSLIRLQKNIGRSAVRNKLADSARFEWLLFLDSDVMPLNDNFISRYLLEIPKGQKAINGGIQYEIKPPEQNKLLRWVYGNEREALSVAERSTNSYLAFLSLNFLIPKNIFDRIRFDETLLNLRHEDTVFSYDLKKNGIPISHIENPVIHFGLDTSGRFLQKDKESLFALKKLLESGRLPTNYVRIGKAYTFLKRTGLNNLATLFFDLFSTRIEKNLTGPHPSLRLFDIYRLCYLCHVKKLP